MLRLKRDKEKQQEINKAFAAAGPFLNSTYFFISAMALFGYAGYKLDQYYNNTFLFLLVGLFTGFALGFYKLYKDISHMEKDTD